jgi:hypothetical protein
MMKNEIGMIDSNKFLPTVVVATILAFAARHFVTAQFGEPAGEIAQGVLIGAGMGVAAIVADRSERTSSARALGVVSGAIAGGIVAAIVTLLE